MNLKRVLHEVFEVMLFGRALFCVSSKFVNVGPWCV